MSVGGPTNRSLVRDVTKFHTVQNPRLRVEGSCFGSPLPSIFWLDLAISLRPGGERTREEVREGMGEEKEEWGKEGRRKEKKGRGEEGGKERRGGRRKKGEVKREGRK